MSQKRTLEAAHGMISSTPINPFSDALLTLVGIMEGRPPVRAYESFSFNPAALRTELDSAIVSLMKCQPERERLEKEVEAFRKREESTDYRWNRRVAALDEKIEGLTRVHDALMNKETASIKGREVLNTEEEASRKTIEVLEKQVEAVKGGFEGLEKEFVALKEMIEEIGGGLAEVKEKLVADRIHGPTNLMVGGGQ